MKQQTNIRNDSQKVLKTSTQNVNTWELSDDLYMRTKLDRARPKLKLTSWN